MFASTLHIPHSARAPPSHSRLQITRNGVTAQGRLAYNLTEGPSANPRWLVKFDGESWKDEELYERSFGKLLRKGGDDLERASPQDYPNKQSRRISSSSDDDSAKNNKRKNVTFSESSPVGSDTSSITDEKADKRAKERKERIARRQAKIEEEAQPKRRADRDRDAYSNKRSRTDDDDDGEVIKVLMMTGTLYLYRGVHWRAEFVRKC